MLLPVPCWCLVHLRLVTATPPVLLLTLPHRLLFCCPVGDPVPLALLLCLLPVQVQPLLLLVVVAERWAMPVGLCATRGVRQAPSGSARSVATLLPLAAAAAAAPTSRGCACVLVLLLLLLGVQLRPPGATTCTLQR
jgi:hypothetical protein